MVVVGMVNRVVIVVIVVMDHFMLRVMPVFFDDMVGVILRVVTWMVARVVIRQRQSHAGKE
jgi:hypothetical protein